jgi:hypothetical protein
MNVPIDRLSVFFAELIISPSTSDVITLKIPATASAHFACRHEIARGKLRKRKAPQHDMARQENDYCDQRLIHGVSGSSKRGSA